MRTLLILICFSYFSLAQAAWTVRDKTLDVIPCPNKGCWISHICKECEALKTYNNPEKGKFTFGGANPGSAICREKLSGKVIIAQDEEGNQESFCVFPDHSLLSLSGVWK